MAQTFTVRGRKFRTQSRFRYIVVQVAPVRGNGVLRRSNTRGIALAHERYYNARGFSAVTIDTTTGQEVAS